MIRCTGIPQPEILHYSTNPEQYGFMFILSESQYGTKFCDAYQLASELERI